MKTLRLLLIPLASVLFAANASGDTQIQVGARVQIVQHPREDLAIWIWPDRGEEAIYHPGDPIAIHAEATRDCFLILYDIDTRGRLNILFPADPWDDNFIAAGEVIRFPRPHDAFDWTVDGPPGVEYIQAIASEYPIDPPDWPVYQRSVNGDDAVCPDPELNDFHSGGDALGYISRVNRKITGRFWDYCATDLATFYVHPRVIQPVSWDIDPWPDVFYGEIYIGWPVGGRIYVDDVFIGVAPLWIPRRHYGRHTITCYAGPRLVRRHFVHLYPKRQYRYHVAPHRGYDVFSQGHVKRGKWGHEGQIERERVKAPRRGGVDRSRPQGNRVDDISMPADVGQSKMKPVTSAPPERKRGWLAATVGSALKTVGHEAVRVGRAKSENAAGEKPKTVNRGSNTHDGSNAKSSRRGRP